ncbi:hypothetical protein CTRI78_v012116 [Colletotrichum trifolii]|uniref:Uncharacterized protein n=1 Tax=Colletotrichum trifolii TaxID=5466 RepID=A0A4R8PR90_COLTR|nr:hypothetical protein CTRI78_v012116 [Colletotrichum trifolii]
MDLQGDNGAGLPQKSSLMQDDTSGFYRDSRVRNPVPSKLHGKTDTKNGNFGVMHMKLNTTWESRDRGAAAKRTSEGTQLAAKMAQTDRYVHIKRSRFVRTPNALTASTLPYSVVSRPRTSRLSEVEIKTERARLLTLLRSLHPKVVVDQLCKALTFFGGLSGTQLLGSSSFPESAESNGSGSMFVCWMAEIFPALAQAIPRRPRGRPRGSKNANGGRDRGLKKHAGQILQPQNCGRPEEVDADDSWVDVDETFTLMEDTVMGANEVIFQSGTGPLNKSQSSLTDQVPSGGVPVTKRIGASTATLVPKKRGRPKGSKNRVKPSGTPACRKMSGYSTSNISSVEANDVHVPCIKKPKLGPGRPKGSKNRPKQLASPVTIGSHQISTAKHVLNHQSLAASVGTDMATELLSPHTECPGALALEVGPNRVSEIRFPPNTTETLPIEPQAKRPMTQTKIKRKGQTPVEDLAVRNSEAYRTASVIPKDGDGMAPDHRFAAHSRASERRPNIDNDETRLYRPLKRKRKGHEVLHRRVEQPQIRHLAVTTGSSALSDPILTTQSINTCEGYACQNDIDVSAMSFGQTMMPTTHSTLQQGVNQEQAVLGISERREDCAGTHRKSDLSWKAPTHPSTMASSSLYRHSKQRPHHQPQPKEHRPHQQLQSQFLATTGQQPSPATFGRITTTPTSSINHEPDPTSQRSPRSAQLVTSVASSRRSHRNATSAETQASYQPRQILSSSDIGSILSSQYPNQLIEIPGVKSTSQAHSAMNHDLYILRSAHAEPPPFSSAGSSHTSTPTVSNMAGLGVMDSASSERMYYVFRH